MGSDAPRPIRWICYGLFTVCPLLFFTDLTRNPYYTQIALLNVLVFTAWLIWLVNAARLNQWSWRSTPLDLPLLALIGWSVLTWISSMLQHPVIQKPIYSEGSKGVIFLFANTFLVYAAATRAQDKILFKRLLWLTYLVSVTAAVYGIAQYFGVEWIWPKALNPYGSRPVSTFGNPNFLSSYLVLVIPVMVGDYLFRSTGLPRVILLAGILTNTGALLATLTRSSWMGLLAAIAMVFIFVHDLEALKTKASKWFVLLLVGLGLLIVFWPRSGGHVYSATVVSRFAEAKDFKKNNYGPVWQRLLIWSSAWMMVVDHPLAGKGWGCFELFYPFYQGRQLFTEGFQLRTHANNAHNEILEYASQIGMIGVGLVAWVWVVFFRTAWSIRRRLDERWRPLMAGMVGGVAGMLVDNLLNVSAHFAVPALMLWWWVGSVFVLDPEATTVRTFHFPRWRYGVAFLTAILLIVGAVRAFAFWRAEINFFEGFKRSKVGTDLNGARKLLERSYAWHPLEVNNAYELANVYARLGMRDEAIKMYGRALDANPGYDELFFNRGTVFMQMDQMEKAIAHYRLCLAINPMSKEAYNILANLYLKDLPRYGDLIEPLYLQATALYPKDRDFWNNLGWVYTNRGNWAAAQNAYQKALENDPGFELARRNLEVVNEKLRLGAKR